MKHKKEGMFVRGFKPGDEFWVGAVRIICKDFKRLAIQAPEEMRIEVLRGPLWKNKDRDPNRS